MTPRINLLNRSELRYQGPVSGKFLAFSSALLVLSTLLLVGSYTLFVIYIQRGQLNWARDSWSYLQPNYKNLMEVKNTTGEIDKLIEELGGWSDSALAARALLDDLQKMLPNTVQLTKMSLSDDIHEPKDKPKDGEKVAAYRLVKISLAGLSHGPQSENNIIDLISHIRAIGGTNSTFATVTLNSMQKNRQSEARSFAISAGGKERELK